MCKAITTALAVLVALSPQAHATLVEAGWNTPEDKLLLLDTDTGLEWLDLPLTAGMSVSEVLSQMSPGGTLEGFRYATSDEVHALFQSAQIPDLNTWSMGNYNPVCDLVRRIGMTACDPYGRNKAAALGYVDPNTDGAIVLAKVAVLIFNHDYVGVAVAHTGLLSEPPWLGEDCDPNGCNPSVGSWLVRPSPAVVLMRVMAALEEKLIALEATGNAWVEEGSALGHLDGWLDSADRGSLEKAEVVKAKQKLHSAMQCEERAIQQLNKSMVILEAVLDALESAGAP